MNKILYLLLLIATTSISAQEINWMTMDEALAAQKEEPKKIFMDVYTTWCGPCKMLDKNTFANAEVAAFISENYYAVKFNAEGTEEINYLGNVYTNPRHDPNRKGRNSQHELAAALKLRGYPTMVFFDEQGNYIQPIVGYHTPRRLEIYVKMVSNDDYKTLTTQEKWAKYQEDFVYTWSK
ncbi:thioredoxin fold domain-containing protein [uncultured Dokdonia sp.]|uniref:thioredoxin family protein n=1 Tax=uncultured Dokdonia sp. TaxID=575653 RepID=UPI0026259972|nr:thioredoxin fold domain-containing protein [uncultured Dokdonia sp.]